MLHKYIHGSELAIDNLLVMHGYLWQEIFQHVLRVVIVMMDGSLYWLTCRPLSIRHSISSEISHLSMVCMASVSPVCEHVVSLICSKAIKCYIDRYCSLEVVSYMKYSHSSRYWLSLYAARFEFIKYLPHHMFCLIWAISYKATNKQVIWKYILVDIYFPHLSVLCIVLSLHGVIKRQYLPSCSWLHCSWDGGYSVSYTD